MSSEKCTQLAELNIRSRWYSAQVWHLPFAYIGLSSILVGTIADKIPNVLRWASLFAGIFGICTLLHMWAMQDGIKHAVNNIQCMERKLGLEETAEYKPFRHTFPLVLIVVLGIVAYFILACGLFSGKINLQSAKSQQVATAQAK